MANEFKHKDPCTTLTQAEYISACGDGHVFACQATGDLLYADSSTVLKRLEKGSTTQMLQIASCKPAWTSTPSLGSTSWANMNHAHAGSNSGGTVNANCLGGTTLKSCVVTSSLTTVGALNSGSISCGFGAIDNGSSAITTTGLISGGSLDIDDVLINGSTIGHTCDTDLITVADQSVTIAGDLAISGGCITLTGAATDIDLIDNNACALSFDASGQAGILAIDTQNCAEGVKMSGKLTVTGAISTTGALTVGACDTGLDVKFFGASAGAYMLYDQSEDQLEIRGASADATTSTGKLLLSTSLTNINANDVIGSINFQAPVEAGGTDAVAIAAGIRAVAQATFTCAVNSTDLIFYTGHSEAATEKFRFTSQGEIGIGGANYGTDGQVLTSGGAGAAAAWEDAGGGCVVCDTSPQLGGSLDAQTNTIVNIGHANNDILATGIRVVNGSASAPAYSFTCDTNSGIRHSGTADQWYLVAGCQDVLMVHGSQRVYINDNANGKMASGLTINQLAQDDEILALKSSDVCHGVTTRAEPDTFGYFQKTGAGNGGLGMTGITNYSGYAVVLSGITDGDNTTKGTGGVGQVMVQALKKGSGGCATTTISAGSDANLFVIQAGGSTARFIFDAEGTAHADVGTATYDDYCDVELLRGMLATTCDQYRQNYMDRFGTDLMYNQQWYEDNKIIGKDSIHYETRECGRVQQRAMINFTGLTMLHHSTIIQLADRLNDRIDGIETQLQALSEGK